MQNIKLVIEWQAVNLQRPLLKLISVPNLKNLVAIRPLSQMLYTTGSKKHIPIWMKERLHIYKLQNFYTGHFCKSKKDMIESLVDGADIDGDGDINYVAYTQLCCRKILKLT